MRLCLSAAAGQKYSSVLGTPPQQTWMSQITPIIELQVHSTIDFCHGHHLLAGKLDKDKAPTKSLPNHLEQLTFEQLGQAGTKGIFSSQKMKLKESWTNSCKWRNSWLLDWRGSSRISIWLLIEIPFSRNGHSSRIKILLSRNFRELHVYLSRGPCWPTTPLMKIRSPPAKLRQRITDHFLVAF